MAFLKIRSYAPTPSMEVIVVSGSRSVIDCKMCATHSHPAFVDRVYWKRVIASTFLIGNGPGHQPPDDVSDHDPPDPTIGLAESCHPLQPDGLRNRWCGTFPKPEGNQLERRGLNRLHSPMMRPSNFLRGTTPPWLAEKTASWATT